MAGTRAAILDCMIEATILVEGAWALDVHTVILPTLKLFQPQDSFVGEKKKLPSCWSHTFFFFFGLFFWFYYSTWLWVIAETTSHFLRTQCSFSRPLRPSALSAHHAPPLSPFPSAVHFFAIYLLSRPISVFSMMPFLTLQSLDSPTL